MTAQRVANPIQFDAAQIMGEIVAARIDQYLETCGCVVELLTKRFMETDDPTEKEKLLEKIEND